MSFSKTAIERIRREFRERFGRELSDDEVLVELELEEFSERSVIRERARQQRVDRAKEERAKDAVRRLNEPRHRRYW